MSHSPRPHDEKKTTRSALTIKLFALALAACLAATGLTGCRGDAGTNAAPEGPVGRAKFLLSATAPSGKVYRLRSAVFDAEGPETKQIDGPLDPTNPEATVTASLAPGAYQLTLREGWRMFEIPPTGAPVEVPALLVSANPLPAAIASGQDAAVVFQFEVGGEVIPPGSATIGIGVNEGDGGLPPDGATPDDPNAVPVIIPDTTHIADDATRAALAAYDGATGTLRFSEMTAVLATLAAGDVLVSAPSSAAPSGYLRKVMAVRAEGDEVVLETVQANLTDAVSQGVLEAHAELTPAQLLRTEIMLEGVSITPVAADRGPASVDAGDAPEVTLQALGVGNNYNFEMHFNHVFVPQAGPGASGSVTVDGSISFNAGYGVHIGISGCFSIPPICVDSFQASVGFAQSAHLKITGEASGMLGQDVLIATQVYEPQIFFIGPFPVVVVPRLNLYLSAGGQIEARIVFEANQAASAQLGARWTDEDGWQDISGFNFDADVAPPTFSGVIKPRAGAKSGMSLKLYDIAGPELSLTAGLELDGHIPRNPIWIVNGFLTGKLTFKVELPVIGTLAEHEMVLFDTTRELARAGNALPRLDLTAKTRPEPGVHAGAGALAGLRVPLDFTPGCPGVLGGGIYFAASDAEDGCPRVTIGSDRDGALPYRHTFQTVGKRVLTITATDSQGASVSKSFTLSIVNNNPSVTLQAAPNPREGEPHAVQAQITDPNEKNPGALCANNVWSVDAPDTVADGGGCLKTVTFGTTGPRQVRVRTHDSDGAIGTQELTVNVLPPPANPFPRLKGGTVFFRDRARIGIEIGLCPNVGVCCVSRTVASDADVDLTKTGCNNTKPYFVEADVENPSGEALTYDWQLYVGRENLPADSSHEARFDVGDVHPFGTLYEDEPCRVELKINAPDPARSKGPIRIWSGQCSYHRTTIK